MNPFLEKVYQIGIIPVIAFNSVDEALPLCKALADGGLPAAEVTFRTACAEDCIRKIHEEMPEMLLGAGTVLTTEQAGPCAGRRAGAGSLGEGRAGCSALCRRLLPDDPLQPHRPDGAAHCKAEG